ncbi:MULTISPECIES: hypothetical protein [Haloarcula]|uniref:Uncharacterized protein n=1 Tax=Haloarcula pellucida TaxID=1427151 RepID=A0A830GLR8_9EURY|nr:MULTISPECIES: hypothetical protein [Halomicroarcula]MBX0349690.1 hypothetical protein [Halomicroarcula pellucida]MDS0279832.1 hypothetical protein [Halomicroarcula sp. S1AR25-4]QIO24455.1 hypothetical protein G9465_18970 [Haloarcula sp. JP-L23]GGN93780.1 hypothetical protein GCM10009030_19500 [Halomicroarcula pellucida]
MRPVWQAFFGTSVTLLGVLALAMPFVEPGTATFAVTLLSAAMLGVVGLGSAAFLHYDWDPFEELFDGTTGGHQ